MEMGKKFYSVKEYAQLAGLVDQSVRVAVREGRIPGFKPTGGRNGKVLIPVEALDIPTTIKNYTKGQE